MDYFEYHDGRLCCEGIKAAELAREFDTPLYVYSQRTLLDHYDRLSTAFAPLNPTICFSVKSCQNLAILRLLKDRGSAFDVVSGGELARVLEIGGDPGRIVFAGVGKTDGEIAQALDAGIGWFNVESEAELENIGAIARARNDISEPQASACADAASLHLSECGRNRADVPGSFSTARCALRVNPDVDPRTHVYTTTGKRETKFGVDLERARRVFHETRGVAGVELSALHLHIGSPVNTVEPYVQSITRALTLVDQLRSDGFKLRAINMGGGFGAHYDGSDAPPAAAYAEQIVPLLANRGLDVLLEPGRSISANAGVLLTRVLYTKQSGDKRYIIVDASITELIRPALYGSFHFAWPVEPRGGMVPPSRRKDLNMPGSHLVDIVGPVCESGDFLAKDRYLPPVARGDLICLFSAGAYGFVMSSQYNSRPRVAEVLVDGDASRLIRRRESYDDLVAGERI